MSTKPDHELGEGVRGLAVAVEAIVLPRRDDNAVVAPAVEAPAVEAPTPAKKKALPAFALDFGNGA